MVEYWKGSWETGRKVGCRKGIWKLARMVIWGFGRIVGYMKGYWELRRMDGYKKVVGS